MKIRGIEIDKIKLSFLDKSNNEIENWYVIPMSFGWFIRAMGEDLEYLDVDLEGLVLYGEEKAN